MLSILKLKIMLSMFPDDAAVKIRHGLGDYEQFVNSLYYEKNTNTVWILGMDHGDQQNIDPDNSIYRIDKEV